MFGAPAASGMAHGFITVPKDVSTCAPPSLLVMEADLFFGARPGASRYDPGRFGTDRAVHD